MNAVVTEEDVISLLDADSVLPYCVNCYYIFNSRPGLISFLVVET
jgi:uncharacterized protein YhbP (UPF0306 family)